MENVRFAGCFRTVEKSAGAGSGEEVLEPAA